MRRIIIAESIILFFLVVIILTHWFGVAWSSNVVFSSCQPTRIHYNSTDPYCLSIIRQQQTLGSSYIILVSKSIEPSYGHVLNYPGIGELDIENTQVHWMNEGIEVETYLKTKLFIPKKNFIGGR